MFYLRLVLDLHPSAAMDSTMAIQWIVQLRTSGGSLDLAAAMAMTAVFGGYTGNQTSPVHGEMQMKRYQQRGPDRKANLRCGGRRLPLLSWGFDLHGYSCPAPLRRDEYRRGFNSMGRSLT